MENLNTETICPECKQIVSVNFFYDHLENCRAVKLRDDSDMIDYYNSETYQEEFNRLYPEYECNIEY